MKPAVRDTLVKHISSPVRINEPLSTHTSFRIGGKAALFAAPRSTRELTEVVGLARSDSLPSFYLGHGSNLLVSDDGFDGIVICAGGELCDLRQDGKIIVAGPGAKLLDLTTFAAALNQSGLEPLSGIPGSVGGGLYMNAGAYGAEISDTLIEVDVLDASGRIRTLERREIRFGYRSAVELQNVIILGSRFAPIPGDRNRIYAEMRRVWKARRSKQPLEYPSAGSVFKRPPGDYAGRLIEAVDGKGLRIGGAMISPKHAGFIINVGNATAANVADLVRMIRRRVYECFGILLEPEIKTVGFHEDPFAIAI